MGMNLREFAERLREESADYTRSMVKATEQYQDTVNSLIEALQGNHDPMEAVPEYTKPKH